jgi:hypothetical protein
MDRLEPPDAKGGSPTMRASALLILCCLLALPSVALAGKNAGGALIVHITDLSEIPSSCYDFGFEPCDDEECFPTIESCEVANTQSNDEFGQGSILWVYGAFPEGSDPGVTVVYFGVEHNLEYGYINAWGFCGPPNTLELPDEGWPYDWQNAGNSVAFGEPVVGEQFLRFYWFVPFGQAGSYFGTSINPTGGYAGFVSDDYPGQLDEINAFGQARWFEPGYNQCPGPEIAACCFEDGFCLLLTYEECLALEEEGACLWLEGVDTCEPNPCPSSPWCPVACCLPDGSCERYWYEEDCEADGGEVVGYFCENHPCPPFGACCYADGSCEFLTENRCEETNGFEWLGEGSDCDPNPCIPVAIEETSWGKIKTVYR